jgi:MYXO-CTERM domain-containing protein
VFVLQGDDFSQTGGVLRYDVIDYKADPRYGGAVGSPYDFAVLRIAGVDATTPTIPLASASDGLTIGTNVLSVGYGRTTLIASGPGTENTVRRHVAKQLGQVGQMIAYDMSSSGICQGDSGGPVLVGSPGSEKVVGVHSYVQGDCNGTGVSGRVSFGLSFIAGEIAKAVPTEDCALCGQIASSGNGTCAAATRSCLADKECGGYYECLSSGATKASCLVKFPKAEGPFNAAANCQCTQACTAQCKGTFECVNTPKCGYKLPAGACTTCTESACCDQALACASDGTCYVCLKTNDAAPECATNAARKAMATCVASKCNAECAGSGLATGADPVADPDAGTDPASAAGPGGGSTTTTTSGCSITHTSSSPSFGLVAFAAALLGLRRRRR